MDLGVAEVEQALLALPERDRDAVIHAGLLSLDDSASPVGQPEVDAAWRDEIGSRLDDVLNDRVELSTFDQTYAQFGAKHPAPHAEHPDASRLLETPLRRQAIDDAALGRDHVGGPHQH